MSYWNSDARDGVRLWQACLLETLDTTVSPRRFYRIQSS